jgi:hypothetical protein
VIAVDDGIWTGNYNLADVLFIIAAIVFFLAAIIPFFRRGPRVDGAARPAVVISIEQIVAAGLCLATIAFLAL